MQEFTLSMELSGVAASLILLVSLVVFWRRVRVVSGDITLGTRTSLAFYGMAGVGLAMTTLAALPSATRFLVPATAAFFLGCVVIAQQWVLFSPSSARISSIAILLVIAISFVESVRLYLGGVVEVVNILTSSVLIVVFLALLAVASLVFALILIRETPSTFTLSVFLLLLLYLASRALGIFRNISVYPETFIVQVLPPVLASTIFASMKQPRRTLLTLFLLLLLVAVQLPLVFEFLDTLQIWAVVAAETFACICLVSPLNYFAKQASDTGARAPAFLGSVVTLVAAMVILHGVSYSVAIALASSPRIVMYDYTNWLTAVLGACALGAFGLATVSSGFAEWIYSATREAVVAFVTAISLLSFPYVLRPDLTPQVEAAIYASIGVLLTITTLLFLVVVRRIYSRGAKKAAERLVLFITSAILMALVLIIPQASLNAGIIIISLIFSGVLALGSSPPFLARVNRTVRRLDQLSELGVTEDGTIRW